MQKENTIDQFMAIIEKAYVEYETAQLRMNLYGQQIETTRAAIDILTGAYSVDGRKFEELLRLEKELIDYDLMILKAVVSSHHAKITVERFITE